MGRPPKHDLSTWTVTDDFPDPVPVTIAEVKVFESWFGDVFDEIFGDETCSPDEVPSVQDQLGPAISEKEGPRPKGSDSL